MTIFANQATIKQYRTVLTYPGGDWSKNFTDHSGQVRDPVNLYTWKIGGEYSDNMNILGLVFFSGMI